MSQRDPWERAAREDDGQGEGQGQEQGEAATPVQPQGQQPEPMDRLVEERSQGPGRSFQAAAARANAAKQQASQALGSAAASLRQRQQAGTFPGGQPVQQAARAVAGTLQNASQGLQQQNVGGMMQQLEQQVREQPLLSLGIAFLAGLILGRLSD
ncbi:MAG TPA: hypothetical protein VFI42_14760 [Thermomicrobiaceae bacterium]|nr:hypothetical protein [Thermomicrobiaceae bacterium]